MDKLLTKYIEDSVIPVEPAHYRGSLPSTDTGTVSMEYLKWFSPSGEAKLGHYDKLVR
jgi:hypothetical protein